MHGADAKDDAIILTFVRFLHDGTWSAMISVVESAMPREKFVRYSNPELLLRRGRMKATVESQLPREC